MNTLDYNVSGEKRKQLVRAMSEILGEDAVYQGAPSFAYRVDGYMVSQNGLVTCPDTATHAEITQLVDSLREQGFVPENVEDDSPVFTVELPRAGFTPTALDNLKKIVASKAELFKRAIGTDTLEIVVTEDRVRFPWFTLHGLEGETDAYTKLIAGICDMAKRQKRVIARERAISLDTPIDLLVESLICSWSHRIHRMGQWNTPLIFSHTRKIQWTGWNDL